MCFLDCDKWCFIACCIENANYICSSAIFGKLNVISVARYRKFYDIWSNRHISVFCSHYKLSQFSSFFILNLQCGDYTKGDVYECI